MWNGIVTELKDWLEFGERLASELGQLRHDGLVAIRNFQLLTADVDKEMNHLGEVDRLEIVRQTGTDRDDSSLVWNAPGHDYDHEQCPGGKSPANIIYAYIAEVTNNSYLVHYREPPEEWDLTEGLCESNGILVYDAAQLKRMARNELWFLTDPREALLLVFRLGN